MSLYNRYMKFKKNSNGEKYGRLSNGNKFNLFYLMREDNIVFSSLCYENDLFIN